MMSHISSTTDSVARRQGGSRRLWPRRKWVQVSLRGFLLVIVAVSIWLAWVSDRARRQERLVNKIIAVGGSVQYEHEVDAAGKTLATTTPPGRESLRGLVGDHYFFRLHAVRCNGLIDDDLRELANFQTVELLQLGERHTDVGMRHLTRLKHLRTIDIESLALTDESLKHFAQLPKLEVLAVAGARFTDDGLLHLAASKNLQYLCILDSTVTQAGANRLKQALPEVKIQPAHFPSAELKTPVVECQY